MKSEADAAEARMRELIARHPPHPVTTRQVAIAYQHALLRIEENGIRSSVTGAEEKSLRVVPAAELAGATTVVPMLDDGRLVLVARYRYAPSKWSLEFPRGAGGALDLSWAEHAAQILADQTGLAARSTILVGATNPDPGIMAVGGIVVLAQGCRQESPQDLNDELIAGTLAVSSDCLDQLMLRGSIDCGPSLAAVALCRAFLAN